MGILLVALASADQLSKLQHHVSMPTDSTWRSTEEAVVWRKSTINFTSPAFWKDHYRDNEHLYASKHDSESKEEVFTLLSTMPVYTFQTISLSRALELGIQCTSASTPVCCQCLLYPGQDLACSAVKTAQVGLWVSRPWISKPCSPGNIVTAGCSVPLKPAGLRPIPFQSLNLGVIVSHCCEPPLLLCQVHLALTTLKDYSGTRSETERAGWNVIIGTTTLVSRYLPHIFKIGPLQRSVQDGARTPCCTS